MLRKLGSCVAFSHHISSVSSSPWQFPSLSLTFMPLTLWELPVHHMLEWSSTWVCSLFLLIILRFYILGKNATKTTCPSLCIIISEIGWYPRVFSFLATWIFITLYRCCLPGSPLVRPCKYSVCSDFYTNFSVHKWTLPAIIIAVLF